MKNKQTADTFMTGYYARAHEAGHDARYTHVHIVKNGKPICGYQPHKTMQFQWNASGVEIGYVDCSKCRQRHIDKAKIQLQQTGFKKIPAKFMSKMTLMFRKNGYPQGSVENAIVGDGSKGHEMFEIKYQFGKSNTKQSLLITQEDALVMIKKMQQILTQQKRQRS